MAESTHLGQSASRSKRLYLRFMLVVAFTIGALAECFAPLPWYGVFAISVVLLLAAAAAELMEWGR